MYNQNVQCSVAQDTDTHDHMESKKKIFDSLNVQIYDRYKPVWANDFPYDLTPELPYITQQITVACESIYSRNFPALREIHRPGADSP
jgi:hypothetical protein